MRQYFFAFENATVRDNVFDQFTELLKDSMTAKNKHIVGAKFDVNTKDGLPAHKIIISIDDVVNGAFSLISVNAAPGVKGMNRRRTVFTAVGPDFQSKKDVEIPDNTSVVMIWQPDLEKKEEEKNDN